MECSRVEELVYSFPNPEFSGLFLSDVASSSWVGGVCDFAEGRKGCEDVGMVCRKRLV